MPGKNMIVTSVSFGQARMFEIRSKADHKQKVSILLENSSYLLMKGNFKTVMQFCIFRKHFQHIREPKHF